MSREEYVGGDRLQHSQYLAVRLMEVLTYKYTIPHSVYLLTQQLHSSFPLDPSSYDSTRVLYHHVSAQVC